VLAAGFVVEASGLVIAVAVAVGQLAAADGGAAEIPLSSKAVWRVVSVALKRYAAVPKKIQSASYPSTISVAGERLPLRPAWRCLPTGW